jgi:hypothetical protein
VIGSGSRTSLLGQVDGAVILAFAGIKQLQELDEELFTAVSHTTLGAVTWV